VPKKLTVMVTKRGAYRHLASKNVSLCGKKMDRGRTELNTSLTQGARRLPACHVCYPKEKR
jgi:hypothetical protein